MYCRHISKEGYWLNSLQYSNGARQMDLFLLKSHLPVPKISPLSLESGISLELESHVSYFHQLVSVKTLVSNNR
jgi:hypothetical protein